MTTDEAMAALAAARLQLFQAAQRREAVVLRRVRIEAPETLDTINADIATARDAVNSARIQLEALLGIA